MCEADCGQLVSQINMHEDKLAELCVLTEFLINLVCCFVADQIKAGYRRMQKRCHPDISGEQVGHDQQP